MLALLARLDPLLEATDVSALRELVRACEQHRPNSVSTESDVHLVVCIDTITVIVAVVFGQRDLLQ